MSSRNLILERIVSGINNEPVAVCRHFNHAVYFNIQTIETRIKNLQKQELETDEEEVILACLNRAIREETKLSTMNFENPIGLGTLLSMSMDDKPFIPMDAETKLIKSGNFAIKSSDIIAL